ncbi:hypothetical protein chiPu_0007873 [Chiloscyllium punctatum]|uniref:Uncharacterized protein n=1 Tax=Chiloscyllium punctatum TaxID=137246 RepID=A0A401SGC5_CHIPU|nr:hypothetical protein [Chiloscyllium punctatum]
MRRRPVPGGRSRPHRAAPAPKLTSPRRSGILSVSLTWHPVNRCSRRWILQIHSRWDPVAGSVTPRIPSAGGGNYGGRIRTAPLLLSPNLTNQWRRGQMLASPLLGIWGSWRRGMGRFTGSNPRDPRAWRARG